MIYYSFTRSRATLSLHTDIFRHRVGQARAPVKTPTLSFYLHLFKQAEAFKLPRNNRRAGGELPLRSIILTEHQLYKSHRYFKTGGLWLRWISQQIPILAGKQ